MITLLESSKSGVTSCVFKNIRDWTWFCRRRYAVLDIKVDNKFVDKPIFIITTNLGFVSYDYDKHKAWTNTFRVKSQNRLDKYRSACERFIEECV